MAFGPAPWDVGRRHVPLMALRGIEVQPHGHGDNATDPQQVPLGVWGLWEPHFLLKINMGSGGDPIPRGWGLKCGVVFSLGMLIPALLPLGPLCPRGKTEPWEQPLCAPRSCGVGKRTGGDIGWWGHAGTPVPRGQ